MTETTQLVEPDDNRPFVLTSLLVNTDFLINQEKVMSILYPEL